MLRNKFHSCIVSTFTMLMTMSLPVSTAQAASAKSAPVTLSAEQVAAKNADARGGLSAWLATQSMSMKGNMDAGKIKPPAKPGLEAPKQLMEKGRRPRPVKQEEGKVVELPFALELQRPHKMRLEIQFAGETAVQVFDGVNGWKLRPFLGRREVESYTPDEMKAAMQQQDMEGPLMDYASKGTKLALDGMEQVDGKDAYKLSLTMKDGQTRHVWVDAKTFLDVKMDGTRKLNGKPRTVSTYFRSYKSVEGLKIPDLIETSVEGIKGAEKIKIDKIALNFKLDASRFTKPE